MIQDITELVTGQAPSLLNAEKGNELIRSINGLRNSRGINGIEVKVDAKGELVIGQTRELQSGAFVFYFENGEMWTTTPENILPMEPVNFWSIQFYIDESTGTLDHNYENFPENPITFESDDYIDEPGLLYTNTTSRVPIIASGGIVNGSGFFMESSICLGGVNRQVFVRI